MLKLQAVCLPVRRLGSCSIGQCVGPAEAFYVCRRLHSTTQWPGDAPPLLSRRYCIVFTACSGEIETGMLSPKRFEKRGKGVINRVGMEQTQLERAFSAQQYSERMLWKNVFSMAPLPRASRYKRKCRRKSKTRTKPCIRFSSDT